MHVPKNGQESGQTEKACVSWQVEYRHEMMGGKREY